MNDSPCHIYDLSFINKQKQEAKKEDARASYEAWKQRKGEILRAMAKERKDRAQRATQEKLEKRQSAIKVMFVFAVNNHNTGHFMLTSNIFNHHQRCLRIGSESMIIYSGTNTENRKRPKTN